MTDQDPTRDRTTTGLPITAPHSRSEPAAEPQAPGEDSAQDAPTPAPEPVLPEVAASLTDALRAMYDTVVDEPLPDAFAQLLSRLDDSDG